MSEEVDHILRRARIKYLAGWEKPTAAQRRELLMLTLESERYEAAHGAAGESPPVVAATSMEATGRSPPRAAPSPGAVAATATGATANSPPPSESAPAAESGLDAGDYYFHLAVLLALSFAPPWVAEQFPSEVTEDKTATFLAVYVATLPLSLALNTVMLGFVHGWFGNELPNVIFSVAGIMAVTNVIGYFLIAAAPGLPTPEDVIHGPPWMAALLFVFYLVLGYAVFYGGALFVASFLVSAWATYWLSKKVLPHLGIGNAANG